MFARTERLLLRPGWLEDAPALFDAIADEGIVRNLAQAPWPYSPGDAEAFLGRSNERRPHEAPCLIFLRSDGPPMLAGAIGIGPTPDGGFELGYWVARRFWGRGIATEAGHALLANARHSLRLPRLFAGHFTDNPASGRVLEKLGFRPTGVTRGRFSRGRDAIAPCRELVLELAEAAPKAACAMAA